MLVIKNGYLGSIFSMMEIVVTIYQSGFVRFDEKDKSFNNF